MRNLTYLIIALSLTSCNLTVHPDGTRSWTLNSEIARAVIVKGIK